MTDKDNGAILKCIECGITKAVSGSDKVPHYCVCGGKMHIRERLVNPDNPDNPDTGTTTPNNPSKNNTIIQ